MKQNLSLVSLFAAVALFFLPWVKLGCVETLGTQTGIEAIAGDLTAGPGFSKTFGQEESAVSSDVTPAWFVLLGLIVIVAAIVAGFMKKEQLMWILACVAGACLIFQMLYGFPLDHSVRSLSKELVVDELAEAIEEQAEEGTGEQQAAQVAGELAGAASERMINMLIGASLKPAFYLAVALCFVPLMAKLFSPNQNPFPPGGGGQYGGHPPPQGPLYPGQVQYNQAIGGEAEPPPQAALGTPTQADPQPQGDLATPPVGTPLGDPRGEDRFRPS